MNPLAVLRNIWSNISTRETQHSALEAELTLITHTLTDHWIAIKELRKMTQELTKTVKSLDEAVTMLSSDMANRDISVQMMYDVLKKAGAFRDHETRTDRASVR